MAVVLAAFLMSLVFGLVPLRAGEDIGTVGASTNLIVVDTPTAVTFTAVLTDSAFWKHDSQRVLLVRTDASGNPTAFVGTMNDVGSRGDETKRDHVYSLAVALDEPVIGPIYFKVFARFGRYARFNPDGDWDSVLSALSQTGSSQHPDRMSALPRGLRQYASSSVIRIDAVAPARDPECGACVFGPQTFMRRRSAGPDTERITFGGNPAADYIIDILVDMGAANNRVTLNGETLLWSSVDGERAPRHIRTAVKLSTQNELVVRMAGKPGSTITVSILGGAKSVGTQGGTIVAAQGGGVLTIPPGALTVPQEVHVTYATNFVPVPELAGFGPSGPAWILEPEGLILGASATLTINVGGIVVPNGSSIDNLLFAHYGQRPVVEIVEPRFLSSTQTVEVDLLHFSTLLGWFQNQAATVIDQRAKAYTSPDNKWKVSGYGWGLSTLKWYVEPTANPTILTPQEITAALKQWTDVSSLHFEQTNTRSQAQIVFVEDKTLNPACIGPVCIPKFLSIFCVVARSGFGQTCGTYFASKGTGILTANDQLTIHMGSNDLETFKTELRGSLIHEIGHALGIAHTPSFVYPCALAPVMTSQDSCYPQSLATPDVAAIQYKYGAPLSPPSPDAYAVTQGTTLTVPPPGVLVNDTVPTSFVSVTFLNAPQGFVSQGSGAFTYTPPQGVSGSIQFAYSIHTTAADSVSATITIQVNPAPPPAGISLTLLSATGTGTSGPTRLAITPSGNFLFALLGTSSVGVFQVASDGGLTPVGGSPFPMVGTNLRIAVDSLGRFLFVTNTTTDVVSVFSIQQTGALVEVSGSPFPAGPNPQGLAVAPTGDRIFVANFGDAVSLPSISVFNLTSDGVLSEVGASPFPAPFASPTSMELVAHPTLPLLVVSGDDSSDPRHGVSVLAISASGTLAAVSGSPFVSGALNGGSRGLAIRADGARLFVVNALDLVLSPGQVCTLAQLCLLDTLSVMTIGANGTLAHVPGSPFPIPNMEVGIRSFLAIPPNGSLVFTPYSFEPAVNGALVIHQVGAQGAVSAVSGSPVTAGIANPRGLVVAPSGQFLYVANAGSQTIAVFRITD
ncbi:MAG: beta-propeller fold lactonase family protein [Vicinamibacterales bacterium]